MFLIIADHDARVQGGSLVPVKSFHIPALILADEMKVQKSSYLTSQIDMAPTLLSLMGIDNINPMLGRDLTQVGADYQGRAIMQYANNFALLKNDQLTVLQPHKPVSQYLYDTKKLILNGDPQANQFNQASATMALALSLWSDMAYNQKLYRLPKQSAKNKHITKE